MSYSTITDLSKIINSNELARVTGDDTGSSIDTDRVNYAIAAADALIDSYLQIVYELPLAESHDIIKDMSLGLTLIFLYEYHYRDTEVPESISKKRKEIVYDLFKLQKGWIQLQNEKRRSVKSKIKLQFSENAITETDLNNFEV